MAPRLALATVLALVAVPAAAAGDADRARVGLDRAVSAARVPELDAAVHRRTLQEASSLLPRLPAARRAALAATLAEVARHRFRYDDARARTLFATLDLATRLARADRLPSPGSTVRDAGGLVYRGYGAGGLRFHPLGSFGELNAAITAGRRREAFGLGFALLGRARVDRGALVWESYGRVAGGRGPWTSGLTQAVAAQALARLGLKKEARLAYRAIPGRLLLRLPQGPWIRLYSHGRDVVLNAQLQAAVSLESYGHEVGDARATTLAARLRRAAVALFPRFDTGAWSRYDLGGGEAALGYHRYVTSLLWRLGRATGDSAWGERALRFRRYWRVGPDVTPGAPAPDVYPVPGDGFRDAARIRFAVSKPATVTLRAAGDVQTAVLAAGEAELRWSPGTRGPGRYRVELTAVDRAGNRTTVELPPVHVRRDTIPPVVRANAGRTRVSWHARDAATPWLRLAVELRRGGALRVVPLGRRPLRGSDVLPGPLGPTWHATLVARDSAGNVTRATLGLVGGLDRLAR